MTLLKELNNEGTTIIMVTHSQSDAEHAHRIVNLLDGQVVSEKQVSRKLQFSEDMAEAV
jgi:putative ABC transport system ATP-binding protein